MTIRTFEGQSDVQPGWRCLELGEGVARSPGGRTPRVGPSGRVVAVDLDTRLLEDLEGGQPRGAPAGHRRRPAPGAAGSTSPSAPGSCSSTSPTASRCSKRWWRRLRPGGTLVVDDGDTFPHHRPEPRSLRRAVEGKVLAAFEAAGIGHDVRAGSSPFSSTGSASKRSSRSAPMPVYRGGSVVRRPSPRSASPRSGRSILAAGATEAQLERVGPPHGGPDAVVPPLRYLLRPRPGPRALTYRPRAFRVHVRAPSRREIAHRERKRRVTAGQTERLSSAARKSKAAGVQRFQ